MITRSRHAHVIHMLDMAGTLTARAFKGSQRAAQRIARWLAYVIGISLCFTVSPASYGSIDAKQSIKSLANYQLTDKQYDCHNEIIYRESRWDSKAIGNIGGTKQAYGLYQLKIKHLRNAHPELQFWKYWEYVSHRYGLTQYDEPNYCKALNHLVTKGWQ